MEMIFIVLMSFLPFQLLGAWILWVANQLSPQAEEWLMVAIVGVFLLPLGMVANFGCSLIVFLVRRNATQLPALKPLQLC